MVKEVAKELGGLRMKMSRVQMCREQKDAMPHYLVEVRWKQALH